MARSAPFRPETALGCDSSDPLQLFTGRPSGAFACSRGECSTFTHVADEETWNRLVRQLPGHNIYQAWSWGALRAAPDTTVRRYALLQAGEPRAAAAVELRHMRRVPLRIAYAPRGPLWREREDLADFLGLLRADLHRSGVLHLKVNPGGRRDVEPTLRAVGFARVPRPDLAFAGILPELTARVPLAQARDAVRAGMEPDARRRVRQAERRAVRISRETSPGAVDELYPWLARAAERQGFYLPSRGALRVMASTWLLRGEGVVLLARHEGECVGGALCSFFGEEALGHFLADDPNRRHLSTVYALYDAGFDEGMQRGCRFFDLGGIRDDPADVLYRFKRQFGSALERHAGEWNLPMRPWLYRGLCALSRGRLARRT